MTPGKLGGDSLQEYCKQDRDRMMSDNEANRFEPCNKGKLREHDSRRKSSSAGLNSGKEYRGSIQSHTKGGRLGSGRLEGGKIEKYLGLSIRGYKKHEESRVSK